MLEFPNWRDCCGQPMEATEDRTTVTREMLPQGRVCWKESFKDSFDKDNPPSSSTLSSIALHHSLPMQQISPRHGWLAASALLHAMSLPASNNILKLDVALPDIVKPLPVPVHSVWLPELVPLQTSHFANIEVTSGMLDSSKWATDGFLFGARQDLVKRIKLDEFQPGEFSVLNEWVMDDAQVMQEVAMMQEVAIMDWVDGSLEIFTQGSVCCKAIGDYGCRILAAQGYPTTATLIFRIFAMHRRSSISAHRWLSTVELFQNGTKSDDLPLETRFSLHRHSAELQGHTVDRRFGFGGPFTAVAYEFWKSELTPAPTSRRRCYGKQARQPDHSKPTAQIKSLFIQVHLQRGIQVITNVLESRVQGSLSISAGQGPVLGCFSGKSAASGHNQELQVMSSSTNTNICK